MYHIEIYNRTSMQVVKSLTATSETEASKIARSFIALIKERCNVVKESNYAMSPRGYVCGQTLYTTHGIIDISTGK